VLCCVAGPTLVGVLLLGVYSALAATQQHGTAVWVGVCVGCWVPLLLVVLVLVCVSGAAAAWCVVCTLVQRLLTSTTRTRAVMLLCGRWAGLSWLLDGVRPPHM
jgi:hypothetical protein